MTLAVAWGIHLKSFLTYSQQFSGKQIQFSSVKANISISLYRGSNWLQSKYVANTNAFSRSGGQKSTPTGAF